MASGLTFEIKLDLTDQVLKATDEAVEIALKQIGEAIEGYAKEDCPVDTGLLRNSLTYAVSGQTPAISSYRAERTSTGQSATSGTSGTVRIGRYSGNIGNAQDKAVYVGSNVEYGPAVEFKDMSHKVGKAHFLRDAGQNHIPEYKEIAEKILKTLS